MADVSDLALASARELVRLFRARETSPVEATRAVLERIERHNPVVNAYHLVDAQGALDAAGRSEARWQAGEPMGLLDGVTVAVKDVFLTRGWPTLRGSRAIDPDQPWEVDAPPVAALRRHGAILTGKTTTPEQGWKAVTDSPLTGVTRNPWDPSKTPGGSSGGSGATLPLGMATLALGTDGGGSIRIPASFCGVAGIKPTYGRVPHWPASPYDLLAHAGPMGRTVADCALLLAVMSEIDLRDWSALPASAALPAEVTSELEPEQASAAGLRIAYSRTLSFARVDPEVDAIVERAAQGFADLGAQVEEVDPGFGDPLEAWETLWYSGAAQATDTYREEQRALMDPGFLRIVEEGRRRSAVDYVRAIMARRDLGTLMNHFHQQYDLLLTPSVPIPPFEAGRDVPEGWPDDRWVTWASFCYPFNITQQPTVAVPCGFTAAGLPVGMQLVASKYRDDVAIVAGAAYEQAFPVVERPA